MKRMGFLAILGLICFPGCGGSSGGGGESYSEVKFNFAPPPNLLETVEKIIILYKKEGQQKFKTRTFAVSGNAPQPSMRLSPAVYEFGVQLFLKADDDDPVAFSIVGNPECNYIKVEVKPDAESLTAKVAACAAPSSLLKPDPQAGFEIAYKGFQIAVYCRNLSLTEMGVMEAIPHEYKQMSVRFEKKGDKIEYRLFLLSQDHRYSFIPLKEVKAKADDPVGRYVFVEKGSDDGDPDQRRVTLNLLPVKTIQFQMNHDEKLIGIECTQISPLIE